MTRALQLGGGGGLAHNVLGGEAQTEEIPKPNRGPKQIKETILINKSLKIVDFFRLCPPSLVGAYYLQPPDALSILLLNDLLFNDPHSVTGGA